MLTANMLEKLGIDKILEYLEFEDKWALAEYMYENMLYTIEDLAEHLNETTVICSMCGFNYAHIEDGLCEECKEHLYNHPNWR